MLRGKSTWKRARCLPLLSCAVMLLTGCAIPRAVQHIGVEYNSAVAATADELTLLNIVRAKENFPLHYTSFSQMNGGVTVTSQNSLATTLKARAPTDTDQRVVGISETVTQAVAKGGQQFVPTLALNATTGPSVTVGIFDTQTFYTGILQAIPMEVISNFIAQGYDSETLLDLTVAKFEFLAAETKEGVATKGDHLRDVAFSGESDAAGEYLHYTRCFLVETVKLDATATELVPFSRISGPAPAVNPLKVSDLALLDGEKLELSEKLTDDPAHDAQVTVRRPGTAKQITRVRPYDYRDYQARNCDAEGKPSYPPATPPHFDHGYMTVLATDGRTGKDILSQMYVIPRSTEGVIQFVGRCLAAAARKSPEAKRATCTVGTKNIITLAWDDGQAVIATHHEGRRYFIPEDGRAQSLQTIALIERFVNLQKQSGDKPITVPVKVIQ